MHFTATATEVPVLERLSVPLYTTPKPPRPSGLEVFTVTLFSSSTGVVSTSRGSFCFDMNFSTSFIFTLNSFIVPWVSGTSISARRRKPHRNSPARKAFRANIFMANKMIPGRVMAPTAAPMSVVFSEVDEDDDEGGVGGAKGVDGGGGEGGGGA